MLWAIVIALLALWALGLFTSTTMGGLIHVLLVASFVVMMIRVLQGTWGRSRVVHARRSDGNEGTASKGARP